MTWYDLMNYMYDKQNLFDIKNESLKISKEQTHVVIKKQGKGFLNKVSFNVGSDSMYFQIKCDGKIYPITRLTNKEYQNYIGGKSWIDYNKYFVGEAYDVYFSGLDTNSYDRMALYKPFVFEKEIELIFDVSLSPYGTGANVYYSIALMK